MASTCDSNALQTSITNKGRLGCRPRYSSRGLRILAWLQNTLASHRTHPARSIAQMLQVRCQYGC
ncbi:hypothetical protein FB451DRAFT_1383055 [Mycena latifolia]|nr:hypothetical protein FB451DRAFT_1383055 [Mycena latifolia]